MDEDVLNQQIRKFLKKVGITSQREIERAVREGLTSGKLAGTAALAASMTLEIPSAGVSLRIEDDIKLE